MYTYALEDYNGLSKFADMDLVRVVTLTFSDEEMRPKFEESKDE